jgi:hypothetical protein
VVTFGPGIQLNEAALVIPQGIRVQINGGTWLGGSPALTLSSGDLTITGATFLNATDAPTILVTGGHLTLRNDIIQESSVYSQAAIEVTGGTADLGMASSPGGNTINVNGAGAFAQNTTATPIAAVGDTFTVNGVPLTPSTLSGFVFEDFNDDGQIDFGENGIANVLVTQAGTDDLGNPVSQSQRTDSDGAYVFLNLRPGSYTITEAQPAGYAQGIDSVGTAGGNLSTTRPELQLRRAARRQRAGAEGADGRHRLLEQQERPGPHQGAARGDQPGRLRDERGRLASCHPAQHVRGRLRQRPGPARATPTSPPCSSRTSFRRGRSLTPKYWRRPWRSTPPAPPSTPRRWRRATASSSAATASGRPPGTSAPMAMPSGWPTTPR